MLGLGELLFIVLVVVVWVYGLYTFLTNKDHPDWPHLLSVPQAFGVAVWLFLSVMGLVVLAVVLLYNLYEALNTIRVF